MNDITNAAAIHRFALARLQNEEPIYLAWQDASNILFADAYCCARVATAKDERLSILPTSTDLSAPGLLAWNDRKHKPMAHAWKLWGEWEAATDATPLMLWRHDPAPWAREKYSAAVLIDVSRREAGAGARYALVDVRFLRLLPRHRASYRVDILPGGAMRFWRGDTLDMVVMAIKQVERNEEGIREWTPWYATSDLQDAPATTPAESEASA